LEATDEFYRRHLCRVVPMPQDLVDTIAQTEAEPTVYHTMNGPNEFHVLGTLRGWSIIDRLPEITAPTLVIAGEFDEATPPPGSRTSTTSQAPRATSSPTPVTARTWRSPRSSAPSSPRFSPATTP
jgi:pimeloyl-ACP methyl ester carboxylesterase